MRLVIIGLGNQGRKRRAVADNAVVATVDPVAPGASFRQIEDVATEGYDAGLVCTSDQAKPEIMSYLLSRGKHVLVEKPLLVPPGEIRRLRELSRAAGVACYTAY